MGRNRNYHVNYLSAWLTPHVTKQANSRQDNATWFWELKKTGIYLFVYFIFASFHNVNTEKCLQ